MASGQASQKVFSRIKVTPYLSGNASSAKDIGWVDMRDYEHIGIQAVAAALSGVGVTAFSIVANSDSDGGGDEVIIKTHAVGSAPDAAGDSLVLECSAEEIASLGRASGYALRYVSAKITCANSSDNIVLTYLQTGARYVEKNKTADVVSA